MLLQAPSEVAGHRVRCMLRAQQGWPNSPLYHPKYMNTEMKQPYCFMVNRKITMEDKKLTNMELEKKTYKGPAQ